jgi:hypothetical protein
MELRAEDGAGGVDHPLVGAVVQVDEVLLEVVRQRGGIDCVPVVLGCDVALSRRAVERGDVVSAVAVFELDGAAPGCEGEELVAETDAEDGDLGGLHQALEVVYGISAVGWVTGSVRDENAIKVVGDLVDGEIEREDRNRSAAGDEGAKDVLLNSAVDDGYVHVALWGGDVEGSLSGDALDEVDLLWVHEGLVLVGVVFLADCDAGEGGAALAEVGDDGAGVDAGDGGDAFAGAPGGEGFDGRPVAVLEGVVGDDDADALDVGGLEVLEEAVLVALVGGDAVVADEGLGEDEDLAAVGGVCHGLGVADEGGREDGLAGDVGLGSEGLAVEDWAVLLSQLENLPFCCLLPTPPLLTYPDSERSPIMSNRCGPWPGHRHGPANGRLDGGQEPSLLRNQAAIERDSRAPQGLLGKASKHVVVEVLLFVKVVLYG